MPLTPRSTPIDCKRTYKPSIPSERDKVNFRFCKGSPHFSAEENKNWFPCKVLRTEISEVTKSVKYSL